MKCSFVILPIAIIVCIKKGQGRPTGEYDPTGGDSVRSLISNIVARAVLQNYDRDHDGVITESELSLGLSESQAELTIQEIDRNDDRSIDLEELKAFWIRPISERSLRVRHFLRH